MNANYLCRILTSIPPFMKDWFHGFVKYGLPTVLGDSCQAGANKGFTGGQEEVEVKKEQKFVLTWRKNE